ncbi:MAG: hypothetical protein QNJ72_07685 [Pleurocapsa sp. MO_226.B13]|nr:hypothetical protein [Pleurocapsa sp. MO_226.B13]
MSAALAVGRSSCLATRSRGEREESGWVGVFPLLRACGAGWSVRVVVCAAGLSAGAWGLPLLGSLPLLFFPCLALLVSAPGCGVPSVAYVGFLCSSLARLLVAKRRPLAFPRGLFLSLCSFLIIP